MAKMKKTMKKKRECLGFWKDNKLGHGKAKCVDTGNKEIYTIYEKDTFPAVPKDEHEKLKKKVMKEYALKKRVKNTIKEMKEMFCARIEADWLLKELGLESEKVKKTRRRKFDNPLKPESAERMHKINEQINNVKKADSVKTFGFVNLYDCEIGENTKIGTFVEIQKGVKIGKNCKISSHSFVCEGVTIEDNVFIGHGVMFTNDLYPRANNFDGSIKTEEGWNCRKTLVKKGVSIGSNATILCGLTIGINAMVGAGSVVIKNIPADTLVYGNPAKRRL